MPNHFEHQPPGVVWCVAEGHYSFEDTYDNYKTALEAPESRDGVNVVIDVRKSLETRTADELREIARLFRSAESFKGKCAMLVSADGDVRYGLARMLGAFSDLQGMDFRVFVKEEEALSWLDEVEVPIVCNLDALSPGERAERVRLVETLRKTVTGIEETAEGYTIAFGSGADESEIRRLIEFEERCCPFLRFELDSADYLLTVTGPVGAKDIVAGLFD